MPLYFYTSIGVIFNLTLRNLAQINIPLSLIIKFKHNFSILLVLGLYIVDSTCPWPILVFAWVIWLLGFEHNWFRKAFSCAMLEAWTSYWKQTASLSKDCQTHALRLLCMCPSSRKYTSLVILFLLFSGSLGCQSLLNNVLLHHWNLAEPQVCMHQRVYTIVEGQWLPYSHHRSIAPILYSSKLD